MTNQNHRADSDNHPSKSKGKDQKALGERQGQPVEGVPTHPEEKRSGTKGESNAGEDETSGSD